MISFKLYENFLAWKPCKDTFQVDGFFAVFELNGYSSCTNKIEMPVSEDYEILSKKFDSFNVNHKSPHETKFMLEMRERMLFFQHNSKPMQK